jgi:hypothetical protein
LTSFLLARGTALDQFFARARNRALRRLRARARVKTERATWLLISQRVRAGACAVLEGLARPELAA